MTPNDFPEDRPMLVTKPDHTGRFVAIFVILGLLIVGEIYSFSRMVSLRNQLQADQTRLASKLNADLSAKVQDLANANAESLQELRSSLDDTATQMSATEKRALARAHYASYLVRRLQKQESHNAQQLRLELSQKADQQQVGSLNQGLAATNSALSNTKGTVKTLVSDLGMARSQLGTLIATNHNDIVALQKLGSRDYYEFNIARNKRKTVAGITLVLKKANMKRHTFNVDMIYNDMTVTRKDLAVDSPVFFAPQYMRQFYEMVVYQIGPNWVKGYISTPKGAMTEVARQRP
ncbi:MAG: hypothetical protein ACRD3O_09900 [Terriglobia bacterium]